MIHRLKGTALFALYQLTVAVGIVMLPLAVALDRIGLTVPMHRVVDRLDDAVDT